MNQPIIALLRGGVSPEREVSLASGAAALQALRRVFPQVEDFEISRREVPAGVMAGTHVVFSTLHGVFGEDGGMQALLEARGISCAGCDAAASDLCFDKQRTKEVAASTGVPVSPGTIVGRGEAGRAEALLAELGPRVVVKPNRQGSSVGLRFVDSAGELREAIASAADDGCVVERCVSGREVTVGVLDGEAMGVVEIRPKSGRFDYASKYTKGLTEYLCPAPLDAPVTARIRRFAAAAFGACGCRDFARVDFMIGEQGPVLLEINTLPGLTETSLLPMSARHLGLDFEALLRRMTVPAIDRHYAFRAGAIAAATRA